jgi:hypothetical protein
VAWQYKVHPWQFLAAARSWDNDRVFGKKSAADPVDSQLASAFMACLHPAESSKGNAGE